MWLALSLGGWSWAFYENYLSKPGKPRSVPPWFLPQFLPCIATLAFLSDEL